MKKLLFLTCVLCILALCACASLPTPDITVITPDGSAEQTPPDSSETPDSLPPDAQTQLPDTQTISPDTPDTPDTQPAASNPRMYSSFAFLVSYDPARSTADFDYFDMLRGKDAVKWLVEQEGYTQADAQAEVDSFADSEFITKNINKQLRTIDLSIVQLKLMYHPNGEAVTDATPIAVTLDDFNAVYQIDRKKILESYFFYVTVKDGAAVSVEQVYWP